MAAYKNGIKTVLIPAENVPDLAEVDSVVKENVKFIPVKRVDTVLETALTHMPRHGQAAMGRERDGGAGRGYYCQASESSRAVPVTRRLL